jgi:hypothetical protein
MVIPTEYRGQRYSMCSSDPLQAGFKIRFGSLNFQATGNDYLMRFTNRAKLHPWRSTGPGPIPTAPAIGAPAPVLPGAAGPSTPRRRFRSGQCSRQAGGKAMGRARLGTTRRTLRRNDAGGRISPRDL